MDYNRKKKERKKSKPVGTRAQCLCYHGLEKSEIKRKEDREVGQNWGLVVLNTAIKMGRGNKEDMF